MFRFSSIVFTLVFLTFTCADAQEKAKITTKVKMISAVVQSATGASTTYLVTFEAKPGKADVDRVEWHLMMLCREEMGVTEARDRGEEITRGGGSTPIKGKDAQYQIEISFTGGRFDFTK